MTLLLHLATSWPAGQPGVDMDLSAPDGANKIARIISDDIAPFSSVGYLISVLKRIVNSDSRI